MSDSNFDQLLDEISNLHVQDIQIPDYARKTNVAGSFKTLTIYTGYVQFAQDIDIKNPEVIVNRSTMDGLWSQACYSLWQVLNRQEETEGIAYEKRIATIEDLKTAILQKWYANGVEAYWHDKAVTSPELDADANRTTNFDLESGPFEQDDGPSLESSPLFYKTIKSRRDEVARVYLEGFDPTNTEIPWQAPPKYHPDEPLRKRSRHTVTDESEQPSPPRRPFMSTQMMAIFDGAFDRMIAASRDALGPLTGSTPKTPERPKRDFTNAFSELDATEEHLQRAKHQKTRHQTTTEKSPEHPTRTASGNAGFKASHERQKQLNGRGR